MPPLFAQVILPLALHDSFTYSVPEAMRKRIKPGQRVTVQFGKTRHYAALVLSLSDQKPDELELKEIEQLLDDEPIVLPQNFRLWEWIAQYYCCTLGDVFRAALPSGLKLESRSKVFLADTPPKAETNEKENRLLQHIGPEAIYLAELQKKTASAFSYAALHSLLAKKRIYIEEKVSSRYQAKTETYVRFHPDIKSEQILNEKFTELKKAIKQAELLTHFCHKIKAFSKSQLHAVAKKELLKGTNFSAALLNELTKKNIVETYQQQVSRLEDTDTDQVRINLLNRHQDDALQQIKTAFKTRQVTLIHGITASGKTEIYIHLIDEVMKTGKQALYLVPEIALTTQIIRRLKSVFGRRVGIYHSKMSSEERVEVWQKVLQFQSEPEQGYQVVLGARSAVFLPFAHLGLIVVDEEHENSFKQFDPAPRYNARDVAVVMAHQNRARVLLGSATPSFESYYNCLRGKYALVKLMKRHAEVALPEIIVADVKRAYKRRQMRSVLTPELYENIDRALKNNEQVILFQNRRGYSPFVECFSCGWIPKCQNCDVSLTYHKFHNRLSCHYCGYNQPLRSTCDKCGSPEIKTRGFGTEKIEDELKSLFKNARIARMDLDTTRTKNAFNKIIHNLENQKTDILIGTQMVTKGLDFEHVRVVGILNADNLINFPDFRAHERAFQLIVQVSGRAGRKRSRGKVFIQTSQPEHPLIEWLVSQNYPAAFNAQMEERKLFYYPPAFRLIKIVVKHKNRETVERVAQQLADEIRQLPELQVLGPEFPLISKIQLWHHKEIWVKYGRRQNAGVLKTALNRAVHAVKQRPTNSSCVVNIDVDPM